MENSNFNNVDSETIRSVSLFERIANSSLLKMFIIFVLILIMMIPMSLVDSLVSERKGREQEVSLEIASKWGMDQVVSAPVLAVPYEYMTESIKEDSKGQEGIVREIIEDWVFLLPDGTTIDTDVKPEYLKRGIYSAVVYNAGLKIVGNFSGYNLKDISVDNESLKWNKAKLILGIQDVKGLSENPKVKFANNTYTLSLNNQFFKLFPNHLIADIPLNTLESSKSTFDIKLELRGSKSINFLPLANQTHINAKGNWNNPSFNGGYLPEDRLVTENTFEAKWSIPSFSRKLPSQWETLNAPLYHFSGLIFYNESYSDITPMVQNNATATRGGAITPMTDMDMVQINFLPEINNYQKINRVLKYGILIIILTFTSLFFTEIIKKQRVHIIQYILIGAAMVLFYSLLLAISEHLGFNTAYLLAAIATIFLIASFIRMITKDNKTALLFAGILSLFYGFIFVLMQLRDYSLIVGTIGVFVILAVLMRVSAKINWYQFDKK